MVAMPWVESLSRKLPNVSDPVRIAAITQCQGCRKYVLAVVTREGALGPGQQPTGPFVYEAHYPMEEPDDSIKEGIPPEIGVHFKEALRCHHIKAFGATVLMCRRALQVSCDMEKAQGNDLYKQIDDLAKNQRITGTLQKMAHRIRLLGKRGAHSDYSDIDASIGVGDADQAITFMHHYLDHVYVLPKQLDEPKGKAAHASGAGP